MQLIDSFYIGCTEYIIQGEDDFYKVMEILDLDKNIEQVFSGTYEQCRAWLQDKRDKAINDEY